MDQESWSLKCGTPIGNKCPSIRGIALAFYANQEVEFHHTVRPETPQECIVIATAARHLDRLPDYEGELLEELLQLLHPADPYVE